MGNQKSRDVELKLTKEYNSAKKQQVDKILKISGLCISVIQLIVTIVFMVMLNMIGLLPTTYEVLIGAVLFLGVLFTFIMQRWKVPGIITKFLSVVVSVVLVVGSVYIGMTHKALTKMSGENTMTSVVGVYVLNDSGVDSIDDLNGALCGKLSNIDVENTSKLMEHVKSNTSVSLEYKDYLGFTQLVDALYGGEVETIILNDSYLGIFEEIEGYTDFTTRAKCIYNQNYVVEIETPAQNNSDASAEETKEDNVLAVYISGIDTRTGGVTSNSNSDVNILCLVNLKTHQILLVNTPRDFYVPLSISNGVRDKLTHAGCYGINCSMDTLSMLYGINIDYYVKVNFTGFVDIIDKLGGVNVNSEYAFTTSHGGYKIDKGMNFLSGEQALGFARERYAFGSGDRQRGKNQMAVIKAVIEKMASSALLANYAGILDSVSSSVATNMPYEKIGELAQMQLNQMSGWEILQYSVNGTGDSKSTFSYHSSVYVMIPDESTIVQAKTYMNAMMNDEIISVK